MAAKLVVNLVARPRFGLVTGGLISLPHPKKPPARAVFSFLAIRLLFVDPLDPVSIFPFLQKHRLSHEFFQFPSVSLPRRGEQGGGASGLARTTTPEPEPN